MGRILLRWVLLPLLVLVVVSVGLVWFLAEGVTGERHLRGEVTASVDPAQRVAERVARLEAAADKGRPVDGRQILFGDLHVHTTYSADAFIFSLPMIQGEGVHPPADACDFARHCAELDFYSINDHAEFLTPWQWSETKESIRECNAAAGDPANPDLVAFLGWEWTQSAPAALGADQIHWGHKNVIFRDTADERVPTRPIGAGSGGLFAATALPSPVWALVRAGMTLGDFPGNLRPYLDFNRWTADVRALSECAVDVAVRDLPPDCLEGAPTPKDLFRKLDDWAYPSLVIPHGTTWGIHAPPRADLADQLRDEQHDPARQRLIEVYSGHGNSELWRELQDVEIDADGREVCAAPRLGYEPCCWRAGEIIRSRCGDAPDGVCEERVRRARQEFVDAGGGDGARGVIAGTRPADWLECGQLAGTFLPALHYRPRMSAQYGLARRPGGDGADEAFRFGLIGSSDNHKARAGSGYKEVARKAFDDAWGIRDDWLARLGSEPQDPAPEALDADEVRGRLQGADSGSERNASYYYGGGLVAVHAAGRSREEIWAALEARNAYGTSGPRILLWFDLLSEEGEPIGPMGSEIRRDAPPRFAVRALGAFEQKPGCADHTRERLDGERLARLCMNECYHPGERRHRIDRIEVVRVRPQIRDDEPLHDLVEDPWRTFSCPMSDDGCAVTFEDPEYDGSREFLYYVRALQEPTPAVNGDPMRCARGDDGACLRARICAASGPEFDPSDDCLAPVRERAWSSPIWVSPPA